MNDERYFRQLLLPEIGTEGQSRLSRSTVLVIGAGGLGSAVIPYLAAAGVGRLIICDHDTVNLTNLNRQTLYTTADLGAPKAATAAERVRAVNPQVHVDVCEGFRASNCHELVSRTDVVVDCTDNFATRLLIDEACATAGVPWVFGAVEGFTGMVGVMHGRRLTEIFPDVTDEGRGPVGILGAVPGVVGALQALECIKIIVGMPHLPTGTLMCVDFKTLTFQTIEF